MCGVVGIYSQDRNETIAQQLLERMNHVQHHRGPDEDGIHVEPGVGLAHKRLSIIDLSHGQQPFKSDDGSVVLVYNGEVYNFMELRKQLEAKGHTFHTHCDTEVILHSWMEWGTECVEKLRGMFAFAVWDRNQQSLFLARDRFGIKPLFYTWTNKNQLLFSSELKSITAHPDASKKLDPKAIEEYFTLGYIPDPRTIFQGVHKLPPAHTLLIKRGESIGEPRCYWDVPFAPPVTGSEADIGNELIHRLDEAVRIRMVADVPLGAFLSGGVDSSAVVAMMSKGSTDPVNTCSMSFGDPKFNESAFAQQVAEYCKTKHYSEQVEPNDFELLDTLANVYDEPYADSSSMPTYRVCQLARKHVTVALSGDGGDEHLAGYRRHRWAFYESQIRNKFPKAIRKPLFGTLGNIYPKLDWAPKIFRAKSTFQALARDTIEGYMHSVSVVPDHIRAKMFSEKFKSELQGYQSIEVFKKHAANAPVEDPLSLVQYIDMKTYLPGDILTKVDRASMAHSLEVRVPLLDHNLCEWISGIQPDLKLHGREGKYIFKKSLESHLPHNILYRPKMGFAVPIVNWFRNELKDRAREAVMSPVIADTGVFDQDYLKKIVDNHQAGISEHSSVIWSLVMFESFHRNVLQNASS